MSKFVEINLNKKFNEVANSIKQNKDVAKAKLTAKGVKNCATNADLAGALIDNFASIANVDRLKDKNVDFANVESIYSPFNSSTADTSKALGKLNGSGDQCSAIDNQNKFEKAEATFYLLFTDEKGELDTSLLTPSSNTGTKTEGAAKEPKLKITDTKGQEIKEIQIPDDGTGLVQGSLIGYVEIPQGWSIKDWTGPFVDKDPIFTRTGEDIGKQKINVKLPSKLEANQPYTLGFVLKNNENKETKQTITIKTSANFKNKTTQNAGATKANTAQNASKDTNTKPTVVARTNAQPLTATDDTTKKLTLTEANLNVSGKDGIDKNKLIYTVSEITGGKVFRENTELGNTATFTQQDIKENKIKFIWNGLSHKAGFDFVPKAGDIQSDKQTFNVTVTPIAGLEDETKVKELQQLLKDKNLYDGEVDGTLGPKTEAATKKALETYNVSTIPELLTKLKEGSQSNQKTDKQAQAKSQTPTVTVEVDKGKAPDMLSQGSAVKDNYKDLKIQLPNAITKADYKKIQITSLNDGTVLAKIEGNSNLEDGNITASTRSIAVQDIGDNDATKIKAIYFDTNNDFDPSQYKIVLTKKDDATETINLQGSVINRQSRQISQKEITQQKDNQVKNNTPVPPNQKQFQKLWASNPSANSPSRLQDLMSLDYVSREVQKKGTSSMSIKGENTARTITKDESKKENLVSKLDAEGIYTQENLPTLKLGESGDKVKLLKHLLNRVLGDFYTNTASDKFDELTKAAVFKFQKNNGLKEDGIVGKNTWVKLIQKLEISKQVMGAWVNAYVKDDGGKEPNKSVRAFVA